MGAFRPAASWRSDRCMCWNSPVYCKVAKTRQGNEPIRSRSHVSYVNNDNRMMSAVNGMYAMRAQCVDALSLDALFKPAKAKAITDLLLLRK